jgi:hypothetical protein
MFSAPWITVSWLLGAIYHNDDFQSLGEFSVKGAGFEAKIP